MRFRDRILPGTELGLHEIYVRFRTDSICPLDDLASSALRPIRRVLLEWPGDTALSPGLFLPGGSQYCQRQASPSLTPGVAEWRD
jgi:hypothetical protein